MTKATTMPMVFLSFAHTFTRFVYLNLDGDATSNVVGGAIHKVYRRANESFVVCWIAGCVA